MPYCLKSPHRFIDCTLGWDRAEAWENAFRFLCAVDQIDPRQSPYWKREKAFKAHARRRGYRVVEVAIVEKQR